MELTTRALQLAHIAGQLAVLITEEEHALYPILDHLTDLIDDLDDDDEE